MSRSHRTSPTFASGRSFDREGFEPLNKGDATVDIPLENVQQATYRPPTAMEDETQGSSPPNEKTGLWHRHPRKGLRHRPKPTTYKSYYGEDEKVTGLGVFYRRITRSSTTVRYLFYVLPVGFLLAVPVVIGATAAQDAEIGDVRIVWVFVWLECCWVGLWISKIFAHFLPYIFQFLCGIVSSNTRKYASVLRALEIPLSLVGWALVSLATFMPIMTRNPEWRAHPKWQVQDWMHIVNRILGAAMISSLIFLAERFFIQMITVNYHRKQFNAKIKESKHSIYLLSLLFDASQSMFPAFCDEFQEEDAIINDTIDVALGTHKKKHSRSGSSTPLRVLRDVGRLGDKVSAAFGTVAQEVTGKTITAHSGYGIVSEALEKNTSCEALARRLWLSFVIEGNESLSLDDVTEVLGMDRQSEAEQAFYMLDKDGNGDISLDEMILTITQLGRDRLSIANSLHDVDQAIKVLDRMLCVIVFIVVCFIFIAFLNTTFITTLATAGTALISLSFVFSVTAQEILGSCIFLFVKHPYDIGDRVDLNDGDAQLVVEHISLLFTVFKRVDNYRMVQIPNILLNTLWVENVSRSKAMKEQLSIFVSFSTTLQDVQLLRQEMQKFVSDRENSRDFQPNIEVEVVGINEMDKLQLSIEIAHKSNWANETVRAARRSKFMCALVLALRKIPIYGPGGGDLALGDPGNPSYSVTVSDQEAAKKRAEAGKAKDQKRLVPLSEEKPPDSPGSWKGLGSPKELNVVSSLNERSPAMDASRDFGGGWTSGVSTTSPIQRTESQEIDETRNILRRETTKGRRKATQSGEQGGSVLTNDLPQIGVTAATPLNQYTSQFATPPAANSYTAPLPAPRLPPPPPPAAVPAPASAQGPLQASNDYWDTGIIEDKQRDSNLPPEEDSANQPYRAFPPLPPAAGRPRDGSAPVPQPAMQRYAVQTPPRRPTPQQQQYPPPS